MIKKISILLIFSNIVLANTPEIELGKKLFFDPILSKNQTQSCATCHNPDFGFIDNRKLKLNYYGAVSIGDDAKSIGTRNAPTTSYAKFSPNFYFKNNKAIGGQFLDGRAKNLVEQAGGPPLNPVEMNMPNKKAIINRLKNNNFYNKKFKEIYGKNVFNNTENAYIKMTNAIAAFEKTKFFAPFDSKYDRYLQGKYDLTPLEDLGKSLFFSNNNTNCASCHQLQQTIEAKNETFSNYQYHNIGVPANPNLNINQDLGLYLHTKNVKDKGKFKTPTLRNIAITAPYMHNGVFKDLKTVILFYDKYINQKNTINPETNKPWNNAEVVANINLKDLKQGKKLTPRKVAALVAFLKTLTDKKYEHLLND